MRKRHPQVERLAQFSARAASRVGALVFPAVASCPGMAVHHERGLFHRRPSVRLAGCPLIRASIINHSFDRQQRTAAALHQKPRACICGVQPRPSAWRCQSLPTCGPTAPDHPPFSTCPEVRLSSRVFARLALPTAARPSAVPCLLPPPPPRGRSRKPTLAASHPSSARMEIAGRRTLGT